MAEIEYYDIQKQSQKPDAIVGRANASYLLIKTKGDSKMT